MTTSESGRVRLASTVHARAVRLYGRDDPRTVAARRELAAAKVHAACEAARAAAGLDDLDLAAVVRTGKLPPEAAASAA